MSYSIKVWKDCVAKLRETPNVPLSEIAHEYGLSLAIARDLIEDIVLIHKIKRRGEKPKKYRKDGK